MSFYGGSLRSFNASNEGRSGPGVLHSFNNSNDLRGGGLGDEEPNPPAKKKTACIGECLTIENKTQGSEAQTTFAFHQLDIEPSMYFKS